MEETDINLNDLAIQMGRRFLHDQNLSEKELDWVVEQVEVILKGLSLSWLEHRDVLTPRAMLVVLQTAAAVSDVLVGVEEEVCV